MENTTVIKPEPCRVSLTKAGIIGGAAFIAIVVVMCIMLMANSRPGDGGIAGLVIILAILSAPFLFAFGGFMGIWPASVYNVAACDDAETADNVTAGVGAPVAALITTAALI